MVVLAQTGNKRAQRPVNNIRVVVSMPQAGTYRGFEVCTHLSASQITEQIRFDMFYDAVRN